MTQPRGLDIDQRADVPTTFKAFAERFPDVAAAHQAIGKAGDAAGPLDRRTLELVKIGMCLGAGLESALKSHTRRALQAGATHEEVEQVIVQGVNTCGLPRTVMAWQWATEQMAREAP